MRSITGNYVVKQQEIPFSHQVAGEWAELNAKQFARIIELLHFRQADKYTKSVSLLALLFEGSGWHILHNLPPENLHDLLPLTNFILEEKPPVKNYFPELNIKKTKSAAPSDDLSNLCFGEWCFAFQFFTYYQLTNDKMWLDKLIATIYRPIDPDQKIDSASFSGDVREKFNENLIEKRSKGVAHIQEHIKLAVMAWFTVSVQKVMEARPLVFPANDDNVQADPDQEEPTIDSRTWLTVFRELLGPKWGTPEQLKYHNAMFVLDGLEDQQIAYKETLASMKS